MNSELLLDEHTWVTLATIVFFLLAAKPAYKKITAALDTRIARIKRQLDEATRIRKEAEELLSAVQKKAAQAEITVENIITRAREEAKLLSQEAEKEIEAEMEKRVKLADQKIARAEAMALEGIREKAIDLAVKAASALLKDSMDDEMSEKFVQSSLAKIDRKLH